MSRSTSSLIQMENIISLMTYTGERWLPGDIGILVKLRKFLDKSPNNMTKICHTMLTFNLRFDLILIA